MWSYPHTLSPTTWPLQCKMTLWPSTRDDLNLRRPWPEKTLTWEDLDLRWSQPLTWDDVNLRWLWPEMTSSLDDLNLRSPWPDMTSTLDDLTWDDVNLRWPDLGWPWLVLIYGQNSSILVETRQSNIGVMIMRRTFYLLSFLLHITTLQHSQGHLDTYCT